MRGGGEAGHVDADLGQDGDRYPRPDTRDDREAGAGVIEGADQLLDAVVQHRAGQLGECRRVPLTGDQRLVIARPDLPGVGGDRAS